VVLCEQELEGLARVTEASGRVEAWGEAEPVGAGLDGRRIHAGALHGRAKAGFLPSREGAEARHREGPALVVERDAVRDRCERGGGDAVDVVVAVDADPGAPFDGRADLRAGRLHVAEEEWVVRRLLAVEETTRHGGIGTAAPDEHGGSQLGDSELAGELRLGGGR